MTRKQIEAKWGVKIVDDSFWNPISCKWRKCYRIYSADGCTWEKGLGSMKRVQEECEKWSVELLKIKAKCA